jgi:hypothetical protein
MFKAFVCVSAAIGLSQTASAMAIDWSGNYRIEWMNVDKTNLDSNSGKSYLLNSLQLSPKIIAADGVNIIGKFNILQNANYPTGQMGQLWGQGQTQSGGGASTTDDANASAQTAPSSQIYVSQLYLNLNQEYGALLAGRAPLEFGMGITHNAGNDMWDHWQTTRDVVGYKFIIGNFFMMPMVGKVYDPTVEQAGSVNDLIYHLEYNNSETKSQIGLFHQTRSAADSVNDAPATVLGGAGATKAGGYNVQTVNIFFGRGWDSFEFKMEGAFNSGNTGIRTAGGDDVKMNGYGIAMELNFPTEGKWHWNTKLGIASGDNPATASYEGFSFNRNYNVAMLLLNHPLGKFDLFTSAKMRPASQCGTAPCAPYTADKALDDEAVSNVIYFAPSLNYQVNERTTWTNTFAYAQLQTNPNATESISKDVGYEWDTGLTYRPHEKIEWINEVGLLFPGNAFQNGSTNFNKGFTYGFSSKAAISF